MNDDKFEGNFAARAEKFDFDVINGKHAIRVLFEVLDHPRWGGKRIEWTGWLTEAAIEMTAAQLRNAGWDGVSLMRVKLPKKCSLKIEQERQSDGRVFPRVRFVNPIRDLRPSSVRVEDGALAELDKLLAAKAGRSHAQAKESDDRDPPLEYESDRSTDSDERPV